MMRNRDQAADYLLANRRKQNVVDNIPEKLFPQSASEAYRIQDCLVDLLAAEYHSQACGYKLACTNQPVMALLGVDEPFSGRLMEHSTHESGRVLEASDFVHRIVEPEFILVMGQDVPPVATGHTAETILPYIRSVAPGIEIVDHRYSDFTAVGANALIADNAIHGACIMGNACDSWHTTDLSTHPVSLDVNGQECSRGDGGNVLDSPLIALSWLANHLQTRGRALKAGEIITTGTACDVFYARAKDRIRADFGTLGSVSLAFN
ncbi:MAG: fumarylacetoacetate hydrolase family protein [Gammaproteobacteria bacterium]|nr:fumarylacetoacetate hydrolase family protein [Gammaproteobacteria bacterium]